MSGGVASTEQEGTVTQQQAVTFLQNEIQFRTGRASFDHINEIEVNGYLFHALSSRQPVVNGIIPITFRGPGLDWRFNVVCVNTYMHTIPQVFNIRLRNQAEVECEDVID